MMLIAYFTGNFCDLEDSIWPPGLPDSSCVPPHSLLHGDDVLRNRKCDQCAETAHCAPGLIRDAFKKNVTNVTWVKMLHLY